MVGIGPEFLQLLKKIEWDSLTARDAVDLRAALKDAVGKSDEWFLKLTRDFTGRLKPAELVPTPSVEPAAKVESGRPQVQASRPREPKPGASTKRKRGRPQIKLRGGVRLNRPDPIAVGGANAETAAGPAPAKLFENSYVSKDGPRADIPASLPADHPRMHMNRESSVTPEIDAQDFHEVETAMQTGRGVKDIFQVR